MQDLDDVKREWIVLKSEESGTRFMRTIDGKVKLYTEKNAWDEVQRTEGRAELVDIPKAQEGL